MKNYIFDSYAIIAYLENENGASKISKILASAFDKDINIFLCIVNWGELYYITLRESGQQACNIAVNAIQGLPITIVDVDMELTKQAAIFKSKFRMSYSDCFAAALSKKLNATLVTGDPEFKQVEKEVLIHWID